MILWLSTLLLGAVSALIPFLPIEVYILGAGASNASTATGVALGIAAGLGATAGKLVWYGVARRGANTAWVQKKLSKPKTKAAYDRWLTRMEGRPWFSGSIMFVSAFVGIPPLLAMAAVAGFLKMPMWVFLPTVAIGRSLRFALLFLGVDFAVH